MVSHRRLNLILSDNSTQFRNLHGTLGTKYSRLLDSLDIKPIFARLDHPETKGKIERWVRTVNATFFLEVRNHIKATPKFSLIDLNQEFKK